MFRSSVAIVLIVTVSLAATAWVALAGADATVLWSLRVPRVAAAFAVGAALALSGLALQLVLRNPLADPYVLGTSSGAALGAVLALVSGWLAHGVGAALGALAAGALLLGLARGVGRGDADDASTRLILVGAMLSATLGAAVTLLLSAAPDGTLRGAIFWLVGDLSGARWAPAAWAALGLGLLGFVLWARPIDRLMLGTEAAQLLGVPVRRLRWALVLGACAATACAVAEAGSIGFVGLVVPQALRLGGVRLVRALAPASALAGGCLLVWADAVARSVAYPLELPVGAIMSLIGAPVFMAVLLKGRA